MPLSVGGSGCHLTHGSLDPRVCTSNGLLIGSSVLAQLTVVKSGGIILSVTLRSLYALVSRLCLTGLPEVAMPYSDMWQDCQITFRHTRPRYAKSSYRSVDPSTLHGNVHQVDHVPYVPTNSAAITTAFPLRLCGGKSLVAVTRERRYSPSRLRVNDDDDGRDQRTHTDRQTTLLLQEKAAAILYYA